MNATKDIQINDVNYQIKGFSARSGSWIVVQFATRGLLLKLENPEKEVDEKELSLALSFSLNGLPEDVFSSVQSKCLGACSYYKDVGGAQVAVPLLRADGSWNTPKEPSLLEIFALTVAALAFNLHPFFEQGALKTLLTVFPNVSQLDAPASTATSSDQ